MKKLFLLCAFACALWSCCQTAEGYKVNVNVSGDLSQLTSDTLVLTNGAKDEADLIKATAVVTDGVAVFEGAAITTPQNVMITVNGDNTKRLARLFLENGTSEVNIVFTEGAKRPEVTVKGGRYQTVADSLNAIADKLYKENNMEAQMQAYGKMNDEEKAAFMKVYDSLNAILSKSEADYIAAEPTSLYALETLRGSVEDMPVEEAEAKLAAFKALPEYAENKNIAKIENVIAIIKSLQPGMVAPDFTQNGVDGNPVKFSDFYKQNKVTMIDFWASWCGPCRAFNPTLVKIYNEYKDKGFGIIGVSLDRDKDSWLKAIEDDKLEWLHVSDLGFWDNEVAKQYNVRFVPQSILVDQEGKIIKRHPGHDELSELIKANL